MHPCAQRCTHGFAIRAVSQLIEYQPYTTALPNKRNAGLRRHERLPLHHAMISACRHATSAACGVVMGLYIIMCSPRHAAVRPQHSRGCGTRGQCLTPCVCHTMHTHVACAISNTGHAIDLYLTKQYKLINTTPCFLNAS